MKKTLIALATLSALAGTVQAQSSVTVYGLFDGGLRNQTNVNAAGDDKLTMGSSGTYHSNRFGFKGTEDLGGGLKALFQLEGGYNSGTGVGNTGLFDRTAKVGLSSAYGTVSLGRQYTIAYDVNASFDPFNHKFSGITPVSSASIGTRNDNAIVYTGTFGAFTARAGYALGEQTTGSTDGSTMAAGLNYDNGPLSLGIVYTKKNDALTKKTGTGSTAVTSNILGSDLENFGVGGAYTMGKAKLSVGYTDEKVKNPGARDTTNEWAWVGLGYQVTPALEVIGAYFHMKSERAAPMVNGKRELFMLSSVYNLSKRTLLYAEIDSSSVSGDYFSSFTATSLVNSRLVNNNKDQVGISAGIVHYF
jgi:predicted porin